MIANSTAKSIKDTIIGTAKDQANKVKEADPMFHAKVTPMGEEKTGQVNQEMNEETEKLQKKGALHKKEDDSFNLM